MQSECSDQNLDTEPGRYALWPSTKRTQSIYPFTWQKLRSYLISSYIFISIPVKLFNTHLMAYFWKWQFMGELVNETNHRSPWTVLN